MDLGIDIGTSAVKVVLVDADDRLVDQESQPLAVSRPQPLWSEQQPDDWWRGVESAMAQLAASHSDLLRAVRGIGLSGQMHGAVLLDANDTVLRPAILWNDGRSEAQCRALMQAVPELTQITGNLAMPGFTAPKLLWVREHEPEIFKRVARVLLPKDYLRLHLSGEYGTDCSDASGTLWLDVGARAWSTRMLDACGLARAQMPELAEGSAAIGQLRRELAARWGVPVGVPIAGGGGDNAASAVGIGAVHPGQGFVSLGTSGVIFVAGDRYQPNPAQAVHAFCHALPQRWHQMSVMLSAASAIGWATRILGLKSEMELTQAAERLSPVERKRAPFFLPYLSGERSPHNNPHAQGVLFGLTHAHEQAAISYAVLEGVCFGLRDGLRTLAAAESSSIAQLSLVGGGARSTFWAQLLADILGTTLSTHEGSDAAAAVGAARLAWLATGGQIDVVCTPLPQAQRFVAKSGGSDAVAPRYQRFRELYTQIKSQFPRESP